jgi:uncharacterized protein (TIGR03435 family)
MAYQLQPFQLQGAPMWTRFDRFDVVAKLEGDPPLPPRGSAEPGQIMLALRTLLADRFKLALHWETQDHPMYVLTRARIDQRSRAGAGDRSHRPADS